ncbi:MAG: AAA family ATPase [Eubacteriales bacterium]|nr:AAA family ATPase [Eubacteriales bacterium]
MSNPNGREYLAEVTEKLHARIRDVKQSIQDGQKEIEGMHEYYWENYAEMDQYGYENFDNQQALLTQVNANQEQQILLAQFNKMLDAPFFGRVDFTYEGDDEPEVFYIGIANFSERVGQLPMIYDWRAPVSSLFYDYDQGAASYEAPGGMQYGEITSKWQYKIRRGKLIYEFESDVKIDDEILGAELAGHGETKLKNIVRTIQKEQNAIIRNTQDRIMVIQGTAGSGKTSVALHRIAYLLYHDRQNLKSSNVLILSPNSVFSDYISRILPELGEENIREMSFDLFAYRQLKEIASDTEELYDHLEQVMRDASILDTYYEKRSNEFLEELEGYILELEDRLMDFRDVEYRKFRKKESEIIELFYYKFMDVPLLSRMDAVAEYFMDEWETLYNVDLAEEEKELIYEKFRSMYLHKDIYVLYSRFLEETGYQPLKRVPIEKRKIAYEDVYPLLYLKMRMYTTREHKGIKHLIIDEMQDYSEIQYRILRKMFPCRMTLLGDTEQTMEAEKRNVMDFLPGIFGKKIRYISMEKSYRNTMEIAEYANRVAGISDMELFERHGKPVTEQQITSMEAAAEEIVKKLSVGEDAYDTAAVITQKEEEAYELHMLLKEKLANQGYDIENNLTYLDRNSSKFRRGLTVTTFYLAKGLEFEQVFAVMKHDEKNPLEIPARYISATRALHELNVLNIGG